MCKYSPGRFLGYAPVSLQFPELAAEQLEQGMKQLGLVGAAIMYVGARQILSGAMTVGGFFTYTLLLGFLVAPLFQVVSIGTQLTEALAGLERTQEVLAVAREDEDPRRTRDLADVRGEVEFDDVRFAYEAGKPVLHGVSFRAAPGTVTALVGPSGAGKSTIIGLVAAFHAPTAGVVRVDGVDLSTVRLGSYRSLLGVVLQETFLFDGTIRENVAFGPLRSGHSRRESISTANSFIAMVGLTAFADRYPEVRIVGRQHGYFADADAGAMHTRVCDESVRIGPAEARLLALVRWIDPAHVDEFFQRVLAAMDSA